MVLEGRRGSTGDFAEESCAGPRLCAPASPALFRGTAISWFPGQAARSAAPIRDPAQDSWDKTLGQRPTTPARGSWSGRNAGSR
ncbi:MAG: hypothetical protein DI549_09040 [Ancylobacter novellus]|uniref:Uncharacterized protein n=1 Tax=Ancylobacter novellus TaxID=921 RepID=A0A2W5SUJ0_ANCNO|nr:MAG: hypothetical protein DI549_09040 [Ancylobacter novellus]